MGLILWEYMVKTDKKLSELIAEIYEITGPFAMERYDLRVPEEQKISIIEKCKNNEYKRFGEMEVQGTETIDGYKFILSSDSWVMIRPSGTEPLLRVYGQSNSYENTISILDQTKATILS